MHEQVRVRALPGLRGFLGEPSPTAAPAATTLRPTSHRRCPHGWPWAACHRGACTKRSALHLSLRPRASALQAQSSRLAVTGCTDICVLKHSIQLPLSSPCLAIGCLDSQIARNGLSKCCQLKLVMPSPALQQCWLLAIEAGIYLR